MINVINFAEKYLFSILLVLIRLWMARIFFYSGLTKISSWAATIYLFKYEYKVPIIPAELAAYLATTVELCAPAFLIMGLCSRLAALPMIAMVAVIQFTYLDLLKHFYWAILLLTIILHGPGVFSFDYLIRKKLNNL